MRAGEAGGINERPLRPTTLSIMTLEKTFELIYRWHFYPNHLCLPSLVLFK